MKNRRHIPYLTTHFQEAMAAPNCTYHSIANFLNAKGITTFHGKPWTSMNVKSWMRTHMPECTIDKPNAEELKKELRKRGYGTVSSRIVSERMNNDGIPTMYGRKWNTGNLTSFAQKHMIEE